MTSIDLNADLGEGGADDGRLIALASSINIACGGHAGSEELIRRSVGLAVAAGVEIGAHPGYEDPRHFGRRPLALGAEEVEAMLRRQLALFERVLAGEGGRLHHVKVHGALYLQACTDAGLAAVVAGTVAALDPGCGFYAPPGSRMAEAGRARGLRVVGEGFLDRGYRPDGTLVARGEPGALLFGREAVVARALEIARERTVTTVCGRRIPLAADTLCVHGDAPAAAAALAAVRSALETAGVLVRPA